MPGPVAKYRTLLTPYLDDVPERSTYKDDGCNLHPACLTCPFEKCRYDSGIDSASVNAQRKAQEIRRLRYEDGLDTRQICARLGVSPRTVHRAFEVKRADLRTAVPAYHESSHVLAVAGR